VDGESAPCGHPQKIKAHWCHQMTLPQLTTPPTNHTCVSVCPMLGAHEHSIYS